MKSKTIYIVAGICLFLMFLAWFFFARQPDETEYYASSSGESERAFSQNLVESGAKAYITGEVLNPGVFEINDDCRVEDLIKLSGGTTELADLSRVNLSAKVKDEQHVIIPKQTSSTESVVAASDKLNINNATKQQFMTLPGIGEKTAEAIVKYRDDNGGFSSIDEIMKINNIGQKTFDAICDYITVE